SAAAAMQASWLDGLVISSPSLLSTKGFMLGRFPQFNRISFRVMNSREPANLRIPFWPHLYFDAQALQLRNHGIQVRNAEVDHPLLLGPTEVLRVVLERAEHGRSTALQPPRIGDVYSEMRGVPTRQ